MASCCLFVRAVLLRQPIFGFEDDFFTSSFHRSSSVPSNMPGFRSLLCLCIEVTKYQLKNRRLGFKIATTSEKSNQHLKFAPESENRLLSPFYKCILKVSITCRLIALQEQIFCVPLLISRIFCKRCCEGFLSLPFTVNG